MADDKRLQSTGFEPRHSILRMSGYAAAAAFCAVSVGANLQYGLSLGRNPIDKATYAVASVAADVFKIAAPLLALNLWSKRFHILAIAGLVLWLGCVGWSMASAVGFVLSSRGDAIAERAAEAATRHGWEAKVERAENQLATLGKHRPPDVIKAELASATVPLHIWRRSRQCLDLTLEESRLACAPVLGLRKELAAAEAAERLEAQVVAGRTQLATASVAGSIADPQASALARLIGADEGTIRTGIALLLAGLIEVGSALGFTLVSVATARDPPPPSAPGHVSGSANTARRHANAQHEVVAHANACRVQAGRVATARNPPPPSDPQHVPGSANTARRGTNAQYAIVAHANERLVQAGQEVQTAGNITAHRPDRARWHIPPPSPNHAPGSVACREANRRHPMPTRSLEDWIQTRLKVNATGQIPAREAYADFCHLARAMDIEPCTETRFGRDFSARIIGLGGIKVKRRDRAYYTGVSLAAQNLQVSLAAAQLRTGSTLVAMGTAEPSRLRMRAEGTRAPDS